MTVKSGCCTPHTIVDLHTKPVSTKTVQNMFNEQHRGEDSGECSVEASDVKILGDEDY